MQLSDRAGDIGSESIAIQNLLGTTASMVDTIMIGSRGELAVAAVGICSQISSLYFNCYWGFYSFIYTGRTIA